MEWSNISKRHANVILLTLNSTRGCNICIFLVCSMHACFFMVYIVSMRLWKIVYILFFLPWVYLFACVHISELPPIRRLTFFEQISQRLKKNYKKKRKWETEYCDSTEMIGPYVYNRVSDRLNPTLSYIRVYSSRLGFI